MTFEEWLGNQIDERNEVYEEIGQECYDNGYEQGRADERKKILDILKTFTESDYNSKECKLLVSDLREALWEGEQKE